VLLFTLAHSRVLVVSTIQLGFVFQLIKCYIKKIIYERIRHSNSMLCVISVYKISPHTSLTATSVAIGFSPTRTTHIFNFVCHASYN